MGTVGVVLLVAFIIVCVLLVALVLVQDDGSHGMGGLLGGRGTAAFGSHSASVLTKATFTLVVLFFALAFSLALLNRRPNVRRDLEAAGAEAASESNSKKWYEDSANTEAAAEEKEESPVSVENEAEEDNAGNAESESAARKELTEQAETVNTETETLGTQTAGESAAEERALPPSSEGETEGNTASAEGES